MTGSRSNGLIVALGRLPTADETEIALRFIQSATMNKVDPHEAWALLWQALFASLDFRYLN